MHPESAYKAEQGSVSGRMVIVQSQHTKRRNNAFEKRKRRNDTVQKRDSAIEKRNKSEGGRKSRRDKHEKLRTLERVREQ
jgi:hypothetical protein